MTNDEMLCVFWRKLLRCYSLRCIFTLLVHYDTVTVRYLAISLLCFLCVFIPVVFAHGEKGGSDNAPPFMQEVALCLSLSENRDACYLSLCEDDPEYLCVEDIVGAVTVAVGPEKAMRVLSEIVSSPLFSLNSLGEGHNLAHVVGRMTSRTFGSGGESFLRCSNDFGNGCQHGFFEVALEEIESPDEAVLHICESMPDKPDLGKTACYHGAGHGIMMNESHHLFRALAVCDQLPSNQSTCHDGVFMEHINAKDRIDVAEHWFDDTDPLAPCNAVDDRYQYGCWYRHGNYLFDYYDYSLNDVLRACLNAGAHIETCLTAVSGSLLIPDFQEKVAPDFDGSFLERTKHLCDQFPEQYSNICHRTSGGEITIFYGVADAWKYCESIDSQYQLECFNSVSVRVDNLSDSEEEKEERCSVISGDLHTVCLHGSDTDLLSETHLSKGSVFFFEHVFDWVRYFLIAVKAFFSNAVTHTFQALVSACDRYHWRFVSKIFDVADGRSNVLNDFDYFGDSVFLSNDFLAVGAFGDDSGGNDRGAVYVFEKNDVGSFVQTSKISPLVLSDNDRLGRSVAYHDGVLASGAYYDNDKKGAVYLFEKDYNAWTQSLKISDNDGGVGLLDVALSDAAHFGASVSLRDDVLVVGAYLDGGGDGAVYVFERDDGAWILSGKIPGSDLGIPHNAAFGRSVSFYNGILAVGAPRANRVYLFEQVHDGTWSLLSEVSSAGSVLRFTGLHASDQFGQSVSLRDGVLLIGSPGKDVVYLFRNDSDGEWGEEFRVSSADFLDVPVEREGMFGSAVSLHEDFFVVGSYLSDSGGIDRGAVYVFENEIFKRCLSDYKKDV